MRDSGSEGNNSKHNQQFTKIAEIKWFVKKVIFLPIKASDFD